MAFFHPAASKAGFHASTAAFRYGRYSSGMLVSR
jgi:hypothetical protein